MANAAEYKENKPRKKLTDKQALVYKFIKNTIEEVGFPPTLREIGSFFGITVKGAYDHLKAIEKKGFIEVGQNKSRAITLVEEPEENYFPPTSRVPLLGTIAAGAPIIAEENIEEYLSFPKSLIGEGDYFALRVRGDSMEGSGIFSGDIAVIRRQNYADNGEIVAAMIEGEATLKRFQKTESAVRLIPDNPSYLPIESSDVVVLGTLKAVFRSY